MIDLPEELTKLTNEALIEKFAEAELKYAELYCDIIDAPTRFAAELAHSLSGIASMQIDLMRTELIRRLDKV